MSDERLRELERQAATGDAEATARLAQERLRRADLEAVREALRRSPRETIRELTVGFTAGELSDLVAELGALRLARGRGETLREAARRRPTSFVGDIRRAGLHELLELALQPAMFTVGLGRPVAVELSLEPDRAVELVGPELAVDAPTVRRLLEASDGGQAERGLPGVALAIVCALAGSAELVTRVEQRERRLWVLHGEPVGEPARTTARAALGPDGFRLRFAPDPELFALDVTWDGPRLERRLQELVQLHPGLEVRLRDRVRGRDLSFVALAGLADLVAELCPAQSSALGAIVHLPWQGAPRGPAELDLEVALTYRRGTDEALVIGYAEGRLTREGGSHVAALREGVADALEERGLPRARSGLGLVAAVAVRGPVILEARGRRLADPRAAARVRERVAAGLASWLGAHPERAAALWERLGA